MEPKKPLETVEHTVEEDLQIYHPFRNLFMLDIPRDRDSRPALLWALGTLLGGSFVYHWLEGWNYLLLCGQPGNRRLWGLHTLYTGCQTVHNFLYHQRHRHPAGGFRPHPHCEGPAHRKAGRRPEEKLTAQTLTHSDIFC